MVEFSRLILFVNILDHELARSRVFPSVETVTIK